MSGSRPGGHDGRRRPRFWQLFRQFTSNVSDHHTLLAAAGVAYFFALALVPAVVAIVSIYGLVAEPHEVADQLEPLTDALPDEAGKLVVTQLRSVTSIGEGRVGISLAIGLFGLLWLVSNAFNSSVMAIRIAHARRSPHNWVQGRIFALKLSLVAMVVTTVVIWSVIALPRTFEAAGLTDGARPWLEVARWPLVLVLASMSLGWIYRMVVGPATRTGARVVAVGIGGIIWIGGTFGMSVAAASADQLQATFGSLGAVAVLLIWLYLSASSMLLAAEAESVLADAWGSSSVGRSGWGSENEEQHAHSRENGEDNKT
ncbi:MAG: YihY/virulence factor BrkB family protein [Actinomycetota bacterium]|nr:YihY/virulence factor BrkB family protein [Actinomycetota bacterium]